MKPGDKVLCIRRQAAAVNCVADAPPQPGWTYLVDRVLTDENGKTTHLWVAGNAGCWRASAFLRIRTRSEWEASIDHLSDNL